MADYRELDSGKSRMRTHTITIDNRSRINITGVSDMESFHEQEIILLTETGNLRIEGEGLHLSKLNLDDGQVVIEGELYALEYEPPTPERVGLFSRMFR
ncbi:sporulation protein YabP [Eubacteriales bacterium OttesenSCG-928-K08]|nr:sporulation protein YabP [Eubacteriales bacterium OttesenSCG-928-K08]